jgi:uncharacterized iron-regulated protein
MIRRSALFATVLSVIGVPAVAQTEAVNPHPDMKPPTEIVDGADYAVYDRQGRRTSLSEIIESSMSNDVLLVGEEHDDMIGHVFELELLKAAYGESGNVSGSGRRVILSLEMFERDVQYVVDEYLAGLISETQFLRSTRPWDFYESRYRGLIEAAKSDGSPVIAANAPRRYVSRVTSEGPESLWVLSADALEYLPPLPFPGPSNRYREEWDALMTAAMDEAPESASGHEVSANAIYSQALWDASMGYSISEALVENLGGFVIHFAGSFHVANETGILERINDYRPGTRVTTVVMTKVDDIEAWSPDEHQQLADYVVLTKDPHPSS